MAKEILTFTREQETLLIPLYSKARNNLFFEDKKAQEILAGVQYDFERLKVPRKTAVTLCMRAKQLDEYTRQFLYAHPQALVLHLGCGLDSRCLRVPHPQAAWIDLDLPDVIEVRKKFYGLSETDRMIASSVTDPEWTEQIAPEGRPVFMVAEGLMMYLEEKDVRALILCLRQKFSGCSLAFDAFSKLTAERVKAHPSLQKTGAVIQWGIDDPHEIERWADGICLKEEWFFSQSPDIGKLDWFYRAMFRLTGSIQAAKKAQRLLYYTL